MAATRIQFNARPVPGLSLTHKCISPFVMELTQVRLRDSSIATAGSTLPSTNSRKAPPPVEM